jgi:hypothetical protein
MRQILLVNLFLIAVALPAKADRLWLVVGASDLSASTIAKKAKPLTQQAPNSLIIQTHDCGDKKNVFAWVAEIATSEKVAQDALTRVRSSVKDAYIKRCDVKPGTLLALRITAIDRSIADVPSDAVNWQDEDKISSTQPLPDGRILVIVRYFVSMPDDPLEGRRERVILVQPQDKRTTLEDNCVSPGLAVVDHGRIAFHCAREQAGDYLLHSVLVFSTTGEKLTEIEHCRNPKWSNERTIVCESESVGPNGKLKLNEARTDLTIEMK